MSNIVVAVVGCADLRAYPTIFNGEVAVRLSYQSAHIIIDSTLNQSSCMEIADRGAIREVERCGICHKSCSIESQGMTFSVECSLERVVGVASHRIDCDIITQFYSFSAESV